MIFQITFSFFLFFLFFLFFFFFFFVFFVFLRGSRISLQWNRDGAGLLSGNVLVLEC